MHAQEFFCNVCEQPFFKTLADDEVEEGSPCPYCGSQDVEECSMAIAPSDARKAA